MSHLMLSGAGVSNGGGGFSPADLSNLELWVRSDLGITLNGSNVSAWADQSGNSRNYSQSTASLQPAYNSSGMNSKPTADFDGTDDILSVAYTPTGAQSIYVAFRFITIPVGDYFLNIAQLADAGSSSGLGAGLILASKFVGYTPYSFMLGGGASGLSVGISDTPDTSNHSLIITYNGSGASTPANYQCYLDGVSKTVSASSTFNLALYGTEASLGKSASTNFPANIRIAEEIVTSAVLSASEITNLVAYSQARYGV